MGQVGPGPDARFETGDSLFEISLSNESPPGTIEGLCHFFLLAVNSGDSALNRFHATTLLAPRVIIACASSRLAEGRVGACDVSKQLFHLASENRRVLLRLEPVRVKFLGQFVIGVLDLLFAGIRGNREDFVVIGHFVLFKKFLNTPRHRFGRSRWVNCPTFSFQAGGFQPQEPEQKKPQQQIVRCYRSGWYEVEKLFDRYRFPNQRECLPLEIVQRKVKSRRVVAGVLGGTRTERVYR